MVKEHCFSWQDHHCSETSLRLASQRRLQAFQSGQQVPAPTIPAMVYPTDAATQAIRRFLPKAPYPEFLVGVFTLLQRPEYLQ